MKTLILSAFALLFTLKMMHVIDWSWWWVTSPLWGPFAVIAGAFILVTFVALLIDARAANRRKWGKL
jgi:hypothetical protein